MKKLLLVTTLSIAVAAVIKRVTGNSKRSVEHSIRVNGRTLDDIIEGRKGWSTGPRIDF